MPLTNLPLPKVERALCLLIADQTPGFSEMLLDYLADDGAADPDVQRRLTELGVSTRSYTELKHDRAVGLARKAVAASSIPLASAAFICSINKPQDGSAVWLNGLRAISILSQLPMHKLKGELDCDVCGGPAVETVPVIELAADIRTGWSGDDFQVANQLLTVLWFNASQPPSPNDSDKAAFQEFLNVISDAPAKTTAVQMNKLLLKQFKGSVEWMFHLETLGFSGVLNVPSQAGNLQCWTDFCDRKKPSNVETRTPTCHWRRGMGFNVEVFDRLFPDMHCPEALGAEQ